MMPLPAEPNWKELSKQVALVVGWRVKYISNENVTNLIDPKGHIHSIFDGNQNQDRILDILVTSYCPYALSIDQAITLIVPGADFELRKASFSQLWTVGYSVRRVGRTNWRHLGAIGSTLPIAICLARLELHEFMQKYAIAI